MISVHTVISQEKSRSAEIAPDIAIEMTYIPAGTFTMGITGKEDQWTVDATAHKVTLTNGFWMAKYETSQQLWRQIMGQSKPKPGR